MFIIYIYIYIFTESYAPDRVLRSASQNLLVVPRGKHCQYGMRTFAMAAAILWNCLNVRDRGSRIRGSPSLVNNTSFVRACARLNLPPEKNRT